MFVIIVCFMQNIPGSWTSDAFFCNDVSASGIFKIFFFLKAYISE